MRSIAFANQKGGVGKTTSAIHVAHGLSLAGATVVLLDLDPQGNATVALQGMEAGDAIAPDAALIAVAPGFSLLPAPSAASRSATDAFDHLVEFAARIAPQVDWLVVDNPPRMDDWGRAGVQLCEEVVVPVQAEFLAMHGLSQMLRTLEDVAAEFAGKGTLRGVLPTMVDLREPVALEVLEDLRRNLGDRMLESVIFRDANLVEAASFGRSAFHHCPWSKGALCYAELTKELIDG